MQGTLRMSINLTTKRVLRLTLHRKAFEVMVTGEKNIEYRKPSTWIKSRLFSKTKKGYEFKRYDIVLFTNGYGNDKPYFVAEFICFTNLTHTPVKRMIYSNGLEVTIENGDYMIQIGKILEIGNYE